MNKNKKTELKLYNTYTREKEVFVPIRPDLVTLYTCGLTVYNYAHIGNLRTYIFEDVLKRVLFYNGYKVKHVMNITDIGHLTSDADEGEDKNVYFDISKFPNYGKLARLDIDRLKAGARVAVDKSKKNPLDFVLWFTKSKFDDQEMKWDSPWGKGYPGWHIECSAISMHYLGEQFDIHCGGIDHIPVHHTNEIAQSEGATGKKWVNYWMHGEFLVFNQEKMSKSKGEFLTLDLLNKKGYSPMVYRYFCLGAHYRQQLSFSYDALETAKFSYNRLRNKIMEIKSNKEQSKPDEKFVKTIKADFLERINDDLNMPEALAVLWKVLRTDKIGNKEKYDLAIELDKVFGLLLNRGEELLNEEAEQKVDTELVEKLIKERDEARAREDWTKSDKIRERWE